MANSEVKTINLNDMSAQQIMQLAKNLEAEINMLESSTIELDNAKNKFAVCLETCKDFENVANNSEAMIPLTTSLYVPGKIVNNNAFLLDIGTKFYVEKSRDGAIDYFDRKTKFIAEQIESLTKILHDKANLRQTILSVGAIKGQQLQQQQQQQASANQKPS